MKKLLLSILLSWAFSISVRAGLMLLNNYQIADIVKRVDTTTDKNEIEGYYIDEWVNKEALRAQSLTKNGNIKEACLLYDSILARIDSIEGKTENYIQTLCCKGTDLSLCGLYDEASECFEKSNEISIAISSDSYDTRYCSLWGLIITNMAIEKFDKAADAIQQAEGYLNSHRLGGINYNYHNERCFIYSKRAELLFRTGNSVEAEEVILEGLNYYDSHDFSCDLDFKIMLLSELIKEYSVNAENSFKSNDISLGNLYYKKALNTIRDNLFLGVEYIDFISNKSLYNEFVSSNRNDKKVVAETNSLLLNVDSLVYSTAVNTGEITNSYTQWGWQVRQLIGDYVGYISFMEKDVQESIVDNGQFDSITFQKFDASYTAYKVVIAPYTSNAISMLGNYPYQHLQYKEYIDIIKGWRNLEFSIADSLGFNYLDSLYNYTLSRSIRMGIERLGVDYREESVLLEYILPPLSRTYVDEAMLDLMYNRIEEFGSCMGKLFSILDLYGWKEIDVEYCNILCRVADEIRQKGYYDLALALLNDYFETILDKASPQMIEMLITKIGFNAWEAGDRDLLARCISYAGRLSSNYGGVYDNYSDFYDVNELISQLILASRYTGSYDKGISSDFLNIAKRLVEENRTCKELQTVNNNTKILLYSEIIATTDDLAIAEEAFDNIVSLDTTWHISNTVNLAKQYAFNGKYEELKRLLSQLLEYTNINSVESRWRLAVYDCQILLAIHEKSIDYAVSLLRQRLELVVDDFFSKSMMLTDLSRTNYWDNYYSLTLEEFTTISSQISKEKADVAYDAALFQKGILQRMSSIVKNNVLGSGDSTLIHYYKKYKDKLLTNSDSVSEMESAFMYQYILHPEFIESPSVCSWHEVKNNLKKDELAIEYSLCYDEDSCDLFITAIVLRDYYTSPKMIRLCSQSNLSKLMESTQINNGYSTVYDTFNADGNQLYNYIWKPIEKELKGIKTVYFAPYANINSISLECIRKREKGESLSELYNMIRVSSTDEVCSHYSKDITSAIVFGDIDYNNATEVETIGDNYSEIKTDNSSNYYGDLRALKDGWEPLNGTKKEIDAISTLLVNNNIDVKVYSKINGTENNFKSYSSTPVSLIHLATHGFYFNNTEAQRINYYKSLGNSNYINSGIRSGIIFSGANTAWKNGQSEKGAADGVLTADEILGMDLSNTDLLVLSTCQSALGDSRSDGIYGIQRSFKMAGVKTIIMSLWQVDDEATSLIMQLFYENYLKGLSKRDAFRIAQKDVRKIYYRRAKKQSKKLPISKRYDSSFYWAPFIMLD